jgi:hypothetical protein
MKSQVDDIVDDEEDDIDKLLFGEEVAA